MPTVELHLPDKICRILIGSKLSEIQELIPAEKFAIITDSNLHKHYGEQFPDVPVIVLDPGEASKNLDRIASCYDQLVAAELDRKSFILGIGGGVICDITGFIASTYLRGIPFGFVATSLLAQVDAAIGGKNGVNFKGYKNIIGVINQPEFVLCEIDMLDTLDDRELLGGLAEIIKYGAIVDRDFFTYLENNFRDGLNRDKEVLSYMVRISAQAKCRIVEDDPFETGRRKILNLGHTFGHALEKLYGIPHGEAVSIGMLMASRISVSMGLLAQEEHNRLHDLISTTGLPVSMDIDYEAMLDAIRMDKKRSGSNVGLVLLEGLGTSVVKDIPFETLNSIVYDLYQSDK